MVKKTYTRYCADCHGIHGEGGKGTGVSQSRPRKLPVLAPALNNEGFQKSASDSLIKELSRNSHKRSPIETLKDTVLQETDYDNLVTYIRTFKPTKNPHTPSQTAGPPIIVRESSYDLETTINNLKEAIVGENFRLIRIQTLDEGFVKQGSENRSQTIILN
ncbi:MAG: c-type cytochrome [Gammaproteobacteria bacterium]|nr:c-type cytochrome [Gammaproteobacteria bacterium]